MPLAFIFSPLGRIIAIALLVGLLGWALYKQVQANGGLKSDNKHLAVAVNEQAKETENERAARLKSDVAVLQRDKTINDMRRVGAAQKRRNQNAVDGPLAPVLAGQLECLRQRSNPGRAGEGTATGTDCSNAPGAVRAAGNSPG